ncbi:MAG TPA: arginase family protein [Polyangiaceae bacterium]|nr:arginase family protein [Polyangiaceae bacterium]
MRKPSTKKKREAKPSARSTSAPPRATTPPSSSRDAQRFRPPSSEVVPRFAGVPTFLRLPLYDDPRTVPAVDVLLCGVPFDGGTSFRPGARFGPRAVREASALARSFSAALGVDVYDELRVADGGDIAVPPHEADSALGVVAERAETITRSGAIGGFIGGDQTLTLGALRGIHRAKKKAFGLLHIDAQSNASGPPGDSAAHHASVIRKAVEEGLIRADSTMQIGVRGPYSSSDELSFALSHGFEIVTTDEVRWDIHAVVSQVRKLVRKTALYVSVDVSALDPAFAPGTAFPLPGGISTWELQQLLRALVGAEIIGFDVVEIAPTYDPSGITALAGVSIVHEILAALADTRRSGRPAPSSHHAPSRRGRRSA